MAGRVVVITGASSGIGAALAERAAAAGHTVMLVARNEARLREVAARCGKEAHVHPADVTSRIEVRRAVAAAVARFDRIDVWVNNVGQGITRQPSELTEEDVELMMRVNVLSALFGMQEVLPHFRDRGTGQVINVSSMLGRMPFAVHRSAYNGAKHFLNALTANFRTEMEEAHPGIVFSLVSPGVVYTDFGKNAVHGGADSRSFPQGQTAEEVADVILRVMASRAPDVYTRPGSHDRVVDYFDKLGRDPE
jgi:short-subunit dehydrogenase